MEPILIRRPLNTKLKPLMAINGTSLSAIDTSYLTSSPISASHYSTRHPPPQPPTEIVPRLFLSDISAAECISVLRNLGITHVLSAMPGLVALPPSVPVINLQISLQDNPFAELAEHLPRSTAFIMDALRDPHARVLVHCVQGVSRSTSIVCAYLIAQYGWSPQQAVAYVKSKRTHADPNPGFVSQLGEYADMLRRGGGDSRSRRR